MGRKAVLKERKAGIKKTMDELGVRAMESKDVKEVRSMNETLKKLKECVDEIQEEIENTPDDTDDGSGGEDGGTGEERQIVPPTAQLRGGNPMASYGQRTFNLNGGIATKANGIDALSLRSDESMVDRLPPTERKPLDLGKYVRGVVTGCWDNALQERNAITTSTTGTIIPQILSAQIIDRARSVSLFTEAGVPIVPMENGNMTIARTTNAPEFKFKAELAKAEPVDFGLEALELKAKMVYGYAYCSLEMFHSAQNLTEILTKVFSECIAQSIDNAMMYGQAADSFAPKGIMNSTEINIIMATNTGFADYVKAIGAVRRKNGNPSVMGINASTDEIISLMTDNTGQPLQSPKAVDELKKIISNQLVSTPENGNDALIFDPQALLIGMQKNVIFRMFTDSEYCIENGAVGFQIYSLLDCVSIYPEHISKITGIKEVTKSK